ncbi:unnamed protein product [Xylocopa violacea]|uniref:Acyltransferase n=1 Tax=Xylocopa violacea TaxID=135666 RepID=A0ABP1MZJ5_XYLVO
MEIFGIKFAPLYVPWKRRMETLSVAVWVFLLGFGNLCSVILTIYLLYCSQITRYLMLLYFVWMYYDWDTCDKGGRSERWINWFLNSAYVRNLADYFPTQLVKTVDLDPNESYLFCVIPHGIVSIGIAGSFMAHKSRYKKLFPGIESRVVILDQHFRIPFLREYTNLFGTISCHPKSVDYRLSMKPVPPYTGKATVLIVGGAAESLEITSRKESSSKGRRTRRNDSRPHLSIVNLEPWFASLTQRLAKTNVYDFSVVLDQPSRVLRFF